MRNKINHNQTLNYQLTDLKQLQEDIHDMYRRIDFLIDKFQQNSKVVEILSLEEKIEWLMGLDALLIFYKLLCRWGFINCKSDCSFDFFKIVFIGTDSASGKIRFYENINELPYIIDCLQDDGFIFKHKNIHVRVAQYFLNKDGAPITSGTLRTSLEKKVRKKGRREFIDKKIIGELLKYKI